MAGDRRCVQEFGDERRCKFIITSLYDSERMPQRNRRQQCDFSQNVQFADYRLSFLGRFFTVHTT